MQHVASAIFSLIILFSIAQSTTWHIFGEDFLVGLVYFIKDQKKKKGLLFSCFACKLSTASFGVNNNQFVCCTSSLESTFSSFACHQQPALHVVKSRDSLFSHIGKDMKNFHVVFLSDKCYCYSSSICSWLT